MSSTFEYIGPVARAYRRVLESEEIKNPRMDDSERKLFYLDEIKRLERSLNHLRQNRGYVNGQEYAMSRIKSTIAKYKDEVSRIERNEEVARYERENPPHAETQPSRQIGVASSSPQPNPAVQTTAHPSNGRVAFRGRVGRKGGFPHDAGGGEEN